MLSPDQIKVMKADDSTCVVCEAPIKSTEGDELMVCFYVKVMLATFRKSVHLGCVEWVNGVIQKGVADQKVRTP